MKCAGGVSGSGKQLCAKTDPQGNRTAKRTLELCPKCLMMSFPLTSELGSCPSLGPPCTPQVVDAQHMLTEGLCMHVYMMFYQILEHSQPDLWTAQETFNEYLLCAITGPQRWTGQIQVCKSVHLLLCAMCCLQARL